MGLRKLLRTRDQYDRTAIHHCITKSEHRQLTLILRALGSAGAAKLLTERWPYAGTPLQLAVHYNKTCLVTIMMEAVDKYRQEVLKHKIGGKDTILQYALSHGRFECTEAML